VLERSRSSADRRERPQKRQEEHGDPNDGKRSHQNLK
jgi:hypothetical protein